jgi:hypothetical protein
MSEPVPRTITYVPGQNAALDKLVQAYDRVGGNTQLEAQAESDERDINDPLGLKEDDKAPGRERAKRMVEKLIKLGALLLVENGVLDPEDQMFAYELYNLNLLNSVDCPLPPKRIDEVRREAFEYYEYAVKEAAKNAVKAARRA